MSLFEILRLLEVMRAFGWRSHASVYGCLHDGTLTQPVKISARSVGWPRGEIQSLLQARIAGASDDQIRSLVDRLHAERQERAAALLGDGA